MCLMNLAMHCKNHLGSTSIRYKSFPKKAITLHWYACHNDATELCITKGPEGHVVGWQAGRGIHGQLVLNTLFIKLDKPAKLVKIDGLPKNVVPITRGSTDVECIFSSDLKEYIHRSQEWVLLNFSMTDYTSQGKTRPINPVDLTSKQLQKSSILLYMFIKKCDCKWNSPCPAIFS